MTMNNNEKLSRAHLDFLDPDNDPSALPPERKVMCYDGLLECVHCTFCADGKQNGEEEKGEIAASAIGLTKEECNLLGLADGSGTAEKITEIYVKRAILFVFSGGKCLIARKIADVEEGKYRISQTSQKPVEYYLCLETDYIKIAKDHAAKKRRRSMRETIALTKKEFDLLKFTLPRADPRKVLHLVCVEKGKLIATDGTKCVIIPKDHDAPEGLYWLTTTPFPPKKFFLIRETEHARGLVFPNTNIFIEEASSVFVGKFYGKLNHILYEIAQQGTCLDIDKIKLPVTLSKSCKIYAHMDEVVHIEGDSFDFFVMPIRLGENR